MGSVGALEPLTNTLRLDHTSMMSSHRYADRFSIVRVETVGARAVPIRKSSNVPALLVSVFMQPVVADGYRLWFDGARVPLGSISALSTNVVDLEAEPAMWGASGLDYVHFHVRRSAIEETARGLGYGQVGAFRLTVGNHDAVLAQMAKMMLPMLGTPSAPIPLALDYFELIVGAHLLQRYGGAQPRPTAAKRGLAVWQQRRATELLRSTLDGSLRLADLARACDLSVSHFARSFKASFGVTCHRWLMERRIERAQELLAIATIPLAQVAVQSGFADQAAFTRSFHRIVGMTPGRWRREHAR